MDKYLNLTQTIEKEVSERAGEAIEERKSIKELLQGKALKALEEARALLDKSVEELLKKDYMELKRNLWLASSNTEYAAFLLAKTLEEKPRITLKNPVKGEGDLDGLLAYSIQNLEEAYFNLKRGGNLEAYKLVKTTRLTLTKLLELLEKKK